MNNEYAFKLKHVGTIVNIIKTIRIMNVTNNLYIIVYSLFLLNYIINCLL